MKPLRYIIPISQLNLKMFVVSCLFSNLLFVVIHGFHFNVIVLFFLFHSHLASAGQDLVIIRDDWYNK